MRKYLLLAVKILGGLVALLILLLVGAAILLNTSSVQKKLLDYSTNLLAERLQTRVTIDSVSVNFLTFDVNLLGLDVEDRQERKMLQVDKLAVDLDLMEMMARRIKVEKAAVAGVRARLYQPADTAANFQFVIDAFRSDKSLEAKESQGQEEKKQKLSLDIHNLYASKIDLLYNEDTLYLERLSLTEKSKKPYVTIDGLKLSIDNHQPRKNTGKPHRGYFDVGHLHVAASLELALDHIGKDTAHVTLAKFVGTDSITGFNVKDLRFEAGINKEQAHLRNITVQQENTVLTFDSATVTLPDKKVGRKLAYQTSLISGHAVLKDISRPFAPVLGKFSIPLELKVRLSGTDSTMTFRDIHVNTTDQKLRIDADGGIDHLNGKGLLAIRFHVKEMSTNSRTVHDIINQFTVKKFMMKQLNRLGAIVYTGDVAILHKKEQFNGTLRTSVGRMNFDLTLDENNKYVLGRINTTSIQLGRVIDMEDIGVVACRANFSFDMSKPRTARIRRQKGGGNLPIGKVSATVMEANYKKIKVKNINTTINSDGAVALGSLSQKNKNVDLLCDFSFTNTDSIQKMKVKPNLKLHNMPWQKKDKDKKVKDKKAKDKKPKDNKKSKKDKASKKK